MDSCGACSTNSLAALVTPMDQGVHQILVLVACQTVHRAKNVSP